MSSGGLRARLLIYYIAGLIIPLSPSRPRPSLARLNSPFLLHGAAVRPLPSSNQTQLNTSLFNLIALFAGL